MLNDKQTLRAHFKQQRALLPQETQAERDAEILSRLLVLPEYRHCKTIFTYVSKRGEVATKPLIQAAWANGKQVAVPRCGAQNGDMRFYQITNWDQLREGAFGLCEPIDECPLADPSRSDALCIVPGLCFDADGYRIGYGRGYYDRFLPQFAGETIGLCPASAMMLRVPRDPTDQAVHMIITEQFVRKLRGEKGDDK